MFNYIKPTTRGSQVLHILVDLFLESRECRYEAKTCVFFYKVLRVNCMLLNVKNNYDINWPWTHRYGWRGLELGARSDLVYHGDSRPWPWALQKPSHSSHTHLVHPCCCHTCCTRSECKLGWSRMALLEHFVIVPFHLQPLVHSIQ